MDWSWKRDVLAISLLVKTLLFPAYFSTDFEVHRNWLAITKSLPVSKWYYEKTSEWTLDYPPFFAWFEWLMAQVAYIVDPQITNVQNLNYTNDSCVIFQRTSVIISELVLLSSLVRYSIKSQNGSKSVIIAASIFLNPGLLIVDHIHFQYNGFLFGILLWSIILAKEGSTILMGVMFAMLLNFKHIYLYLAPAYFVYLLRVHCMSNGSLSIWRLLTLGSAVITVFVVSLAPFSKSEDFTQLLVRLFPFTRGLNHAYWAPNFWALYAFADRVLLRFADRLQLTFNEHAVDSVTRGLVGDSSFAILPDLSPRLTFLITFFMQLPALIKLWYKPTWKQFVGCIVLCAYSSFLFGWHVHEKAILLILIPYSFLAAESEDHERVFMVLGTAGLYSLFPLLFHAQETPIKISYTLIWIVFFNASLSRFVRQRILPPSPLQALIGYLEQLYLFLFIPVHIIVTFLTFFYKEMEFFPLMITSVYCSIGVIYSWIKFQVIYMLQ